jgi:hypothetical protein
MLDVPRIKNVIRSSPFNRVLSVTFWTKVRKDFGFSVPQGVARILHLRFGDDIALDIWDTSAEGLYHGRANLKSETEIYGPDFKRRLTRGNGIIVTASNIPERSKP